MTMPMLTFVKYVMNESKGHNDCILHTVSNLRLANFGRHHIPTGFLLEAFCGEEYETDSVELRPAHDETEQECSRCKYALSFR